MVERIGNEDGVEFGGRVPETDAASMSQLETGVANQPNAQTEIVEAQSRVVVEMEQSGILRLPANTSIDRPQVNGSNLEFIQADGTIIVVPDGAVQGLTILIGDVEIPPLAVAALFDANGIEAAAGPAGSGSSSSGGNFEVPVGGIGDAFNIGDLLAPTELAFSDPQSEDLYPGNNRPTLRLSEFRIRLSEEGLALGLGDGLPSGLDSTDDNFFFIDLGASDPDNDPLTFTLGLPNAPLTSGGQPVLWSGVGTNHLIGKVGAETIIDITVGGKTGIVLIQLLKPIDHPDGDIEDVITMGVRVTVSDGRGGTASAMLNIGIEDDSPIASNLIASPVLQDEAHNGGNVEHGAVENSISGGPGSLFQTGADGFKSLALSGPEMSVIPVSKTGEAGAPVAVVWSVSTVGGSIVLTGTANGFAEPVAILTVRPDGSYTYVQNAPVASSNAAHDGVEETDAFTFNFTITDGDNDSDNGALTIRINDDRPVATKTTVVLTVAENDIHNLRSQGSDPFKQDADADSTSDLALLGGGYASTVSGSLASTVSFGADGRGGFEFTADAINALNALALSSKGGAVVFTLVGNAVIGYVDGAFTGFQPLIDRPVMSLELNEDGSFTFRLYDQLDHVDDNNTEGKVLKGAGGGLPHIDFGSVIRAHDGDGDSITLDGNLQIVVKDDIPELNTKRVIYGVVEEEHASATMLNGNEDTSAYPDLDQDTTSNLNRTTNVVSGSGGNSLAALITNGADEGGKFSFKSDIDPEQMSSLTSGRQPVVLSVVDHGDGSQSLVGKAGNVDVFQLAVNANGAWTFTLLGKLDHHALAVADDKEGLLQINFGEFLQYTDYDGDTIGLDGANFLIKIIDDIPVIKNLELTGNSVQHDETVGRQNNSEDNDVKFNSLPKAVRDAFDDVSRPGSDPDVSDSDKQGPHYGSKAIGFAASNGAVLSFDAKYGADEGGTTALALVLSADGVSSGLFTTEGREIFLFKENGLIVGRYDVKGGTVNARDPAAFAVALDAGGKLYLVQWVSLQHNLNGADHDDTVSVFDDVLKIEVTVTDGDGDSVKSTISIGNAVRFDDDGPSVEVSGASHKHKPVSLDSLRLDESIGHNYTDRNAPADDVRGVPQPSLLHSADPTKAIGIMATPSGGKTVASLFDVDVNGGADGLQHVKKDYELVLRDDSGCDVGSSAAGVKTNLVVTAINGLDSSVASRTIYLFKLFGIRTYVSEMGLRFKESSGLV